MKTLIISLSKPASPTPAPVVESVPFEPGTYITQISWTVTTEPDAGDVAPNAIQVSHPGGGGNHAAREFGAAAFTTGQIGQPAIMHVTSTNIDLAIDPNGYLGQVDAVVAINYAPIG